MLISYKLFSHQLTRLSYRPEEGTGTKRGEYSEVECCVSVLRRKWFRFTRFSIIKQVSGSQADDLLPEGEHQIMCSTIRNFETPKVSILAIFK